MAKKSNTLLREPRSAGVLFGWLRRGTLARTSRDQPRVNAAGVLLTWLISLSVFFSLGAAIVMARLQHSMQGNVDRSLINLKSLFLEAESDLERLAALLPGNCRQARIPLVRASLDSPMARRLLVLYAGAANLCGPLPEIEPGVIDAVRAYERTLAARAAALASEPSAFATHAGRRHLQPVDGPAPGLLLILDPGNGSHVMAQIDSRRVAMATNLLEADSADGYQVVLQRNESGDSNLLNGVVSSDVVVAGQAPRSKTLFEVTAAAPELSLRVVAHLTLDQFARQFLPALPGTLALAGAAALLLLIRVNGRLARRASAARRLAEAVRQRRFEPVVQPIVDSRSGRCLGGEVLMRWDHPIRGLVAPAEFIGLAEQSGLIGPMTEILMRKARDRLAPLLGEFPDLYFSFNVTAIDLSDPSFPDRLDQLFDEQSLTPRHVMIELIERDVVDRRISEVLAQLRERGYRIAIDDFGTGHSSLSVLARLSCDRLKIDREFVRSIDEDAINRPVLDAIIELSRKLRLPAIAEGVETQAQRAYLVAHGVAALQGYLIARPMPISDFGVWVKDNRDWADSADDAQRVGKVFGLEVPHAG